MESTKAVFDKVLVSTLIEVRDYIQDPHNVAIFVAKAMNVVNEQCPELHGFEKKDVVIDIVSRIIDTMPIDDEPRQNLQDHVIPILPQLVDLLVASAKGQIIIKEDDDVAQSGCGMRRKKTNKTRTINIKATEEDAITIIYDRIRDSIVNKHISVANVLILVTSAMKIMEEFPAFSGEQKKRIVIVVIQKLFAEIQMTDQDRIAMKILVEMTVNKMIDVIVSAAKGELFTQIKEIIDKCFPNGCCPRKA